MLNCDACIRNSMSPELSWSLAATSLVFKQRYSSYCAFRHNYSALTFRYVLPVRLRVANVIKLWIDLHYYDFARDASLLRKLLHFIRGRR